MIRNRVASLLPAPSLDLAAAPRLDALIARYWRARKRSDRAHARQSRAELAVGFGTGAPGGAIHPSYDRIARLDDRVMAVDGALFDAEAELAAAIRRLCDPAGTDEPMGPPCVLIRWGVMYALIPTSDEGRMEFVAGPAAHVIDLDRAAARN